MRTRVGTGRTGDLVGAQVAFGRFLNRLVGGLIVKWLALGIARGDHLNVVVRATVGAGGATDAGQVIDYHPAVGRIPMNGAGGTANHANGIQAMHAGVGDHESVIHLPVADEPRIIVMRGGAGPHTIIAARAAVQINDHGGRAVDQPLIHDEFHHFRPDFGRRRFAGRGGPGIFRPGLRRQQRRGQGRQNVLLHNLRGNKQHVNIAQRPE